MSLKIIHIDRDNEMKKKLRLNVEEIRVDPFIVLVDGEGTRGTVRGLSGLSDRCSGTHSDELGVSEPCLYCLPMGTPYTCDLLNC